MQRAENIDSDWRQAFARAAEAERSEVAVVHLFGGGFLDCGVLFGFLGAFDLQRGEADLRGDGNVPVELTARQDAARHLVAVLDPRPLPARVDVAGEVLDSTQLVAAYERASGRLMTVVHHGSLGDLDALIEQRRTAAPRGRIAGPGAMTAPSISSSTPS